MPTVRRSAEIRSYPSTSGDFPNFQATEYQAVIVCIMLLLHRHWDVETVVGDQGREGSVRQWLGRIGLNVVRLKPQLFDQDVGARHQGNGQK